MKVAHIIVVTLWSVISFAHPTSVEAAPSLFYASAGVVLEDDSTIWCQPQLSGDTRGQLEAAFVRAPSDAAEPIVEGVSTESATLRARVRCTQFADGTGENTELTSDAGHARVSVRCPDNVPFGQSPSCQIDGYSGIYVYLPVTTDAQNVPRACEGARVRGIKRAEPHSQVTGYDAEFVQPVGYASHTLPTTNQQLMRSAQVAGTDEGVSFLAGGKLYFAFGDTTDLPTNTQVEMALQPANAQRSNVLAVTTDFDPSDGVQFDSFETRSESSRAIEVVPSSHDIWGTPGSELTTIPLAGFGLSSAHGERYRFLWYVSINSWGNAALNTPTISNYSGFAYSRDESPDWTRLPAPSDRVAADFGPGAIWFDRLHRYLYLFGIKPAAGPVRLARVRSTFDAVADPSAREYWNGKSWQPGDAAAAVDVLPATSTFAARSEISVAFNAAAGVWTMMLLNASTDPASANPGQTELWQAPAVTGPWTKVDADAELPRSNADAANYGPMMSEHLMRNGGEEVFFLSTQWWPVYNVHLWSFQLD